MKGKQNPRTQRYPKPFKLSLRNLQSLTHTTLIPILRAKPVQSALAFHSLPRTATLDHLIKSAFTQIGEPYPSHGR
jgi:hypothetical protein